MSFHFSSLIKSSSWEKLIPSFKLPRRFMTWFTNWITFAHESFLLFCLSWNSSWSLQKNLRETVRSLSSLECSQVKNTKTRRVSSIIHSARPAVSPVPITILTWNFFCLARFWKMETDGRTRCVKIVITTAWVSWGIEEMKNHWHSNINLIFRTGLDTGQEPPTVVAGIFGSLQRHIRFYSDQVCSVHHAFPA